MALQWLSWLLGDGFIKQTRVCLLYDCWNQFWPHLDILEIDIFTVFNHETQSNILRPEYSTAIYQRQKCHIKSMLVDKNFQTWILFG